MKNKRGMRLLLALLFASFMLYGVFYNAFGANTKLSMAFFAIRETRLGLLVTAQSVLCLAVTLYLSIFGERFNKLRGVTVGLLILAAASLLIGMIPLVCPQGGGYALMLVLYAVAGIGFTAIDLLMNGVMADVFPEKKNAYLSYVHAFYGMGAMLAPLFVTAVVREGQPQTFATPYALLGIAGLATVAPLTILGRKFLAQTPYANRDALRTRAASSPAEVFQTRKAWLLLCGTAFFLFFQTGVSTWLPAYCTEYLRFDYVTGTRVVSLYFLGALAMRFLSPRIYRRTGVARFYLLSVAMSFGLFMLCFLIRLPSVVFIGLVTLGGFLLGASVPLLVILCCDAFPTRTASASGIVIIAVSVSSFVIPTAMGWMIQTLGYFAPMLVITCCLPLSVLVIRLAVRTKQEPLKGA